MPTPKKKSHRAASAVSVRAELCTQALPWTASALGGGEDPFLRTLHSLGSRARADIRLHQAFQYVLFHSRWEDSISGSRKSSHMTVLLPRFEDKEDSFCVCVCF